jgi:hypothetical protein
VLSVLLKTPIKLTVITRTTSKAAFSSSVAVARSSYYVPSLTTALTGQDEVICRAATDAFSIQLLVIDAAVAASVNNLFK